MSDAPPKVVWLHRRASGTLREVWREKPSPLAMFENIPYHRAPTEAEIQEMVREYQKQLEDLMQFVDSQAKFDGFEAGIRAAFKMNEK